MRVYKCNENEMYSFEGHRVVILQKNIVALILFCCLIVLFLLLRINISQGIRQEEIHSTKRVNRTLKIATGKTTKDVDFASTSKHLGRVWITFTSFTCQMISLSLGRRQSFFRFFL